MNRRTRALAVLAIAVTHFFWLGNLPFFGSDEPRYARVAEEMLIRGNYVTPTLNFLPWLEKPPLLFWLESASFRLLGVSEWTARLPVALLSTLTILACSWFLFRQRNRTTGTFCLFVLTTSPLFYSFGRAASTDAPLTACLTAALLAAYLAARSERLIWAALAGLALGLAALAKGLVGPFLFAGILMSSSLLSQRWHWNYRQTLSAALICIATAFPWGWLVWLENGYNFIATFFVNHHLVRFLTPVHRHDQPIWFYLLILALGFFPWVFFLGSSFTRLWKRVFPSAPHAGRAPSLDLFLWVWILFPLGFFSFSGSKLAGYILPVFPALGMLVAMEWDRYLKGDMTAARHMRKQTAALGAFAILLTLALFFGSFLAYGSFLHGAYLGACILAGTLIAFRGFREKKPRKLFATLAATMVIFAGLAYGVAAPTIGSFYSAKKLVLLAKPHLTPEQPLIFYRFFHHTALYYSGYQATADTVPDIESMHTYLKDHPQQRYFIMSKRGGLSDLEAEFDLDKVTPGGDFFLIEMTGDAAW